MYNKVSHIIEHIVQKLLQGKIVTYSNKHKVKKLIIKVVKCFTLNLCYVDISIIYFLYLHRKIYIEILRLHKKTIENLYISILVLVKFLVLNFSQLHK